jgi:hypothetical protein
MAISKVVLSAFFFALLLVCFGPSRSTAWCNNGGNAEFQEVLNSFIHRYYLDGSYEYLHEQYFKDTELLAVGDCDKKFTIEFFPEAPDVEYGPFARIKNTATFTIGVFAKNAEAPYLTFTEEGDAEGFIPGT